MPASHRPSRCAHLTLNLTVTLAVVAGCASPRGEEITPRSPAPIARTAAPAVAKRAPIADHLTVAELVSLAQRLSPDRASILARRAQVQALARSAGAYANPELEVHAGQGRPRDGGDQAVGGIDIRQRLELPGTRADRIAATQAGVAVVEAEHGEVLLEVENEVRIAVAELAIAAASLAQAEVGATTAASLRDLSVAKEHAGEADAADVARVELEAERASILVERRRRTVTAARAAIQGWGAGGLPDAFVITDADSDAAAPATVDDAMALARHHPRVDRAAAIAEQRRRELQQARSARRPDVAVGAGIARGTDGDEATVSLGVQIPIWNQGQDGVAAAESGRAEAAAQVEAQTAAILREARTAWAEDVDSHAAVEALRSRTMPLAERMLALRIRQFEAGDVSTDDVLEARRAAQVSTDELLAAEAEARRARIRLLHALGSFTNPPSVQGKP